MANRMHFILSDWQDLPPAGRCRPRPARRPSNVTASPIYPSAAAFPCAKRYSENTYLATKRRGGRPVTCRSARRTAERHGASAMGQTEAATPRLECGTLIVAQRPCDGMPWRPATC